MSVLQVMIPTYTGNGLMSAGLPGDEYRMLKAMQNLEQTYMKHLKAVGSPCPLRKRFTSIHNKGAPAHRKNYKLTKEQRIHRSRMAGTVRKALGGGFNPSDCGSYRGNAQYTAGPHLANDWNYKDDGKPIPQKHIDEFNKRWYKDELEYDTYQYTADRVANAPWHKHAPIYPMYRPDGQLRDPQYKHVQGRSRGWTTRPPELKSKWSASTLVSEDEVYEECKPRPKKLKKRHAR